MWDKITSACPFLYRDLTLNLERWIRSLLTSQDYKKLLLNVRPHSVTQCFPCCLPVLLCPALRQPASQCAPGLIVTCEAHRKIYLFISVPVAQLCAEVIHCGKLRIEKTMRVSLDNCNMVFWCFCPFENKAVREMAEAVPNTYCNIR